jgi:lipopolysaccharide export system protein LptA
MKKKIFLQLLFFSIFFLITLFFFKIYFLKNENDLVEKKIVKSEESKTLKNSNEIHNLEYVSEDSDGNKYIIKSKSGIIDLDKPELIQMKNVLATINLKNSFPISISSDNAIYNNVTHDTKFSKNIVVNYINNTIKSDNMDLFFNKNFASIYSNVIYKNLNTQLQADKVEMDLITKNSKIFMEDKSKKVKIISLN